MAEMGICDNMNNYRQRVSPCLASDDEWLAMWRNMFKNRIVALGALLLAMLVVPGTAGAAVDGESVVSGKCTACHSAERIRESAKTEAEWTELVDKEIDRGAQLSRAERSAAIKWLSDNYGAIKSEEVEAVEVEEEEPLTGGDETEAEASGGDAAAEATSTLPFDRQAETGVELWQFLLTGGAMMAGGAWMRRR